MKVNQLEREQILDTLKVIGEMREDIVEDEETSNFLTYLAEASYWLELLLDETYH